MNAKWKKKRNKRNGMKRNQNKISRFISYGFLFSFFLLHFAASVCLLKLNGEKIERGINRLWLYCSAHFISEIFEVYAKLSSCSLWACSRLNCRRLYPTELQRKSAVLSNVFLMESFFLRKQESKWFILRLFLVIVKAETRWKQNMHLNASRRFISLCKQLRIKPASVHTNTHTRPKTVYFHF